MNFTPQQRAVIDFDSGNCKVVATAGSGKTTALTERARQLADSGKFVLGLTFSRAAAESFKKRAGLPESKGVFRTFHSLAINGLREHTSIFNGSQLIAGSNEWLLTAWADQITTIVGDTKSPDIIRAHSRLCLTGEDPSVWSAFGLLNNEFDEPTIEAATLLYKKIRKENKLTFDICLLEYLKLLNENQVYRDKFRDKVDRILVDEFQDTDCVQVQILRRLYRGDNLMAVGDSDQSLYSFRGAEVKYLINFKDYFGDHETLALSSNFRCGSKIVSLADSLIKNNKFRDEQSVEAANEGGEIHYERFDTPLLEANYVGEVIEQGIKEGRSPSDYAVMYRVNSYSGLIESELAWRKIPFMNSDESEGYFGLVEVKTLISYLRVFEDPMDVESLKYIWNRPNRFLSKKLIDEAAKGGATSANDVFKHILQVNKSVRGFEARSVNDIRGALAGLRRTSSPGAALKALQRDLKYKSYLQNVENSSPGKSYEVMRDAVVRLEAIAAKFNTFKSFLNHVDYTIRENKKKNKDRDAVVLTTIHKAKGLEWPSVFVAGCNDDMLPHKNCSNVEEERRIMFVAITRAKEELHLCTSDAKISRFLAEMPLDNE